MKKQYIIIKQGNGYAPHGLANAEDPNDTLWLCSCGGTANMEGLCDGTHAKKKALGCCCWYCRDAGERAGKAMDQKKCARCEP